MDPRVGMVVHARVGDTIAAGAPLVDLHLAEERPDQAARARACFRIEDQPAQPLPLVIERIA